MMQITIYLVLRDFFSKFPAAVKAAKL